MALTIAQPVWSDWIVTEMVNLNNIISSPYVEFDPNVILAERGPSIRIPKLKSLDAIGDDERITSSTTLTPKALEDYVEIAPIIRRGNAISITDVEILTSGVDPLKLLAPQIAQYNIRQIQRPIKSVINGVFAVALASSHTYDNRSNGDGKIDVGPIEDAVQSVLGETADSLTGLILHSKVAADLKKKSLTNSILAPVFNDGLITTGVVLTYWGKRIIVNDTICAPFTEDGVVTYPSYLLAGTPVYVGWQKSLNIYTDFDPATGGGTNKIFWYAHYAIGFRGVSFNGNIENPTDAQLADGSNWTKVAPDNKLIRVVRLLTK
ncbi:MAG: major capsid protein [Ignavibacteria bacterium]|nr:major capsid protein [Ignavibacteria bacterium]